MVEKVSGRLLLAAVADSSERVRTAVLQALVGTVALDDYMAQVWGGRPSSSCDVICMDQQAGGVQLQLLYIVISSRFMNNDCMVWSARSLFHAPSLSPYGVSPSLPVLY